MGHLVGQQVTAVTAGGPSWRKTTNCLENTIVLTAEKRGALCQSEDLKVTIVLMCMPNIYPQVQTFHQSVILDCRAHCFSVLRLWTGDMFFLRRMLKAMVEKALEEALHDKVA